MANEHVEEVGLKFSADGSVEFQASLKNINAQMAQNYAEFVRETAEMDKNATATEKLTAKRKLLESQLESQKSKVSVLRSELDTLTNSEDKNDAAIAKKAKELTYAEAQLAKYETGLKDVTDELKKHSEWTDKASKNLKEFGDKTTEMGQKMSVASAAIVGLGAASIAAFNEVDGGMDIIIKKTGATGDALVTLGESYYAVYGSMPITADQAGIAIGEVNTRFLATGDTLTNLSTLFLQFAEVTDTDLNTSIANTSKITKQWGLDTAEIPGLLGLITAEGQRTGVSVGTLMNNVIANGSTLKSWGLDIGSSIQLLASFEQNGVESSVALAAMRKATNEYAKDGIALTDGLSKTISSIQNASTETKALAIAQEVFGTKGALEMTTAIREGRFSIDDFSASMETMGTVVVDTFEATQDPPDKMAIAMNNLKIVGSDVGNSLLTALVPMIDSLIATIKSATDWFKSLTDGQKQTILVVFGVIAAIGPLLILIGQMATGLSAVIAILPALKAAFLAVNAVMAANPIGIVIIAIVALVAAIVLLWNNCEWFRDLVKGMWEWIKKTFSELVTWLKAAFSQIGAALSDLYNAVIKPIVDKAMAVFKVLSDYLGGTFKAVFTAVFAAIGGILSTFFSTVGTVINNVKDIFLDIISFIKNVFTGNWSGAWENVVSIFGKVFGTLGSLVKAPINAVISMINGAISGINQVSISIPDWVPGLGGQNFGFNIGKLPLLASGGNLLNGMAIVAEAGPELIQQSNGRTIVTPLSGGSKNGSLSEMGLSDNAIQKLSTAITKALIDAGLADMALTLDRRELGRVIRGL